MKPFRWDFEPHTVNFKLSFKASFHPSLAGASLVLPWLDGAAIAKGELPTFGSGPETIIPFSGEAEPAGKKGGAAPKGKEKDAVPEAAASSAGGLERSRVSVERELGSFPVTLDLVRALQRADLQIGVRAPGGPEGQRSVRGNARIDLAPLLLAGTAEDGGDAPDAQDRGEEDARPSRGAPGLRPHVRPCWVAASGTDTVCLPGLHKWELRISTEAPALSRPMLERLKPMCLTVEAVRGLPNEPWLVEKCEDVYLEVYPHLSASTQKLGEEFPRLRTMGRPHNSDIAFGNRAVWLLGLARPETVRQWLAHEGLVVEVHDRDLKPPPQKEPRPATSSSSQSASDVAEGEADAAPPQPKKSKVFHPHGVAKFLLAPLLDSKTLSETLRVGVCPSRGNKKRRRAEDMVTLLRAKGILDHQEELDNAIETRADKREDTTDYHGRSTACILRAELAVPLPDGEEIRRANEEGQRQRWESGEQRVGETNIWQASNAPPAKSGSKQPPAAAGKAGGSKRPSSKMPQAPPPQEETPPEQEAGPLPFRAKVPLPTVGELVGPWRVKREEAEADDRRMTEALQPPPAPPAPVEATLEGASPQSPANRRASSPSSPKTKGKRSTRKKSVKEKEPERDPAEIEKDVARAQAVRDELHKEKVHGLDLRYERYGRMVLLVSEKERPTIQEVLRVVRLHNAEVMGIDPDDPELRTVRLTEEQKADPHFDLLTGFTCLEGGRRLMVVEGLRERAMHKVLEAVPDREIRSASETYKLLHNPSIGFPDRIYGDFGAQLKQIKVREPLNELTSRPELYSNNGLTGDDVLAGNLAPKLLMEMVMAQKMKYLHQADCWPTPSQLSNLEMLYGAYVTDGELEADPTLDLASRVDPRSALKETIRYPGMDRTLNLSRKESMKKQTVQLVESEVAAMTVPISSRLSVLPKRPQLCQSNPEMQSTLDMRKSSSAPDLIRRNMQTLKEQSDANVRLNNTLGKKRNRETPFLEGKGVHIYSGQALNTAELQKDWMRKHMERDWQTKLYTHSLAHESQSFDISGVCPPGALQHKPSAAPDSFANLPGDDRPPWRLEPARPKEAFRKPSKVLDEARRQELREAFIDNEQHHLGISQERQKPIAVHKTFDPERVPHHRSIADRPFDPSMIGPKQGEFGPKSIFESAFYHGRKPFEAIADEAVNHNYEEERIVEEKMLGARAMGCFTQGATRQGISDLDRCEPVSKLAMVAEKVSMGRAIDRRSSQGHEDISRVMKNTRVNPAMPVTIRTMEAYQDNFNPAKEWHARLRENDSSPSYDVTTGGYVPRDNKVGVSKQAVMSGKLGKAPWRHGAEVDRTKPLDKQYVSQHDFDLTRQPPVSKMTEAHLSKKPSRAAITTEERASKAAYSRPAAALRAVAAPA